MSPEAGVLKIFALIFSSRWIKQWQKEKKQEQAQTEPSGKAPRPVKGQGPSADPKARKKGESQSFYDRIFSLQVTLWCMIFQRLNSDQTLDAVLKDLRKGGADHLRRRGKKISRRIQSNSTSAYSQARHRLPVEFLEAALEQLRRWLLELVGGQAKHPAQAPPPAQRSRQILDGSTLCALSTPALEAEYPPARNGRSVSDWCLVRVVVGFCARSGAVLGAIEGAITQSEQALSWTLMERAQAFTIWIGDRNFGVWSVVSQAQHCRKQAVVVRLTSPRVRKLADGVPLQSGEDRAVIWQPSRYDKGAPGVKREGVSGRLIYVRLKRKHCWIDLHLFTTLDAVDYPLELLVEWYGQRWEVELNFRYVKTQMKMEQLHVSSPEMARKEFYAGMLAYSLVRAVMWGAGRRLEMKRKISFSAARRIVREWLKDWGHERLRGTTKMEIQKLLREVAGELLPKRRKTRPNEPRQQRHRSQKFPPLRGSRAKARLEMATKEREDSAKQPKPDPKS